MKALAQQIQHHTCPGARRAAMLVTLAEIGVLPKWGLFLGDTHQQNYRILGYRRPPLFEITCEFSSE